jgi:transposase
MVSIKPGTRQTADLASDDGVMGPRGDRPKRRVFTAAFKAAILAEYDGAERGQRGQILRREGLYSSHVIEWRRARDAGAQQALGQQPGRSRRDPRDVQIAVLTARAAKAEAELARSQAALEIVGKVHALLETLSESADTDPRSSR